jgi:hypothetical protein
MVVVAVAHLTPILNQLVVDQGLLGKGILAEMPF